MILMLIAGLAVARDIAVAADILTTLPARDAGRHGDQYARPLCGAGHPPARWRSAGPSDHAAGKSPRRDRTRVGRDRIRRGARGQRGRTPTTRYRRVRP